MNLRKAPPRAVLEIWRTGSYGQAQWHHRLECGHIEVRKRKAPAEEIKCAACLEPENSPRERDARYDPYVADAALVQRATAGLAAQLGVDQELITVVTTIDDRGTPQVSYAQVMFTADHLKRMGLT